MTEDLITHRSMYNQSLLDILNDNKVRTHSTKHTNR